MLAWVLNTPLLFEGSLNILFLESIISWNHKILETFYFCKLLITSFNLSNMLLNIELLNHTFPLTRTKALVNKLLILIKVLIASFNKRATLKNFYVHEQNFTYTNLPLYIYQKFTSWKTQRKHVKQKTAI